MTEQAMGAWSSPVEPTIGRVPFAVHVHLALIRAYEHASRANTTFFARWGLTSQQYNVLRIVYFSEEPGVRLSAIRERLLQHVPDVSRLVDRLEATELATRVPDPADGRAVLVALTATGRSLVEDMDAELMEALERCYAGLTASEQRRLEVLLTKATESLRASEGEAVP